MTRLTKLAVAGLAGITALGAVSQAMAADLPYAAPVASAPMQYSVDISPARDLWTGFYVGGHLGGLTSDDFSETNSAWTGGIHAGYTHQFDAFVIGAEVQASLTDALHYELVPGAGLSEDWSISAKGRAGVALGNTLVYGTGGLSIAELSPSGATTSAAETHLGASFGAGIEQALGGGFAVRAEYQQTHYFDVESSVGGVGRTDDLTNHALTVGLNYRF